MLPLIGLTGLKGSGKSQAAKALINIGYHEDAYAKDLKDMVYRIQGICVPIPPGLIADDPPYLSYQNTVDILGLDQAKNEIPQVRKILQTFGTDVIRNYVGADFWVDRVRERAEHAIQNNIPYVITDIRFPNEAKLIKDLNGHIVRIERPSQKSKDQHQSETHISSLPVDHIIYNNSTISHLHQKMLDFATNKN